MARAEHLSHAMTLRLQPRQALPPSRERRIQLRRGGIGNEAHLRSDDIGKAREDVGVKAIRLRQLPRRLRNVPHLAWIHHHHGPCRGGERGDGEQLVSAGRLQPDQLQMARRNAPHHRTHAPFIMLHGEALCTRQHADHQLGVRHIDADTHLPLRPRRKGRPRPSL